MDQLNCTKGSLTLTPIWDPDKPQNIALKRSPTVFDFAAPKNLKKLNFTASLELGENIRVNVISIPSPRKSNCDVILKFEKIHFAISAF